VSLPVSAPERVRYAASNGQGIDFEGTVAADADLDGVVEFVDDDDGRTLQLNGWLWIFERLD
jgi:hypothetical protein